MYSSKKLTAGVALGAALAFAMACGGSAFKGETGPAGAAAPAPATPTSLYTSTVGKVEIKGVSIDTTTHLTKVQFTVADANDIKITTGVSESSFRFGLAKLTPPASTGDTNRWQSYINRTRTTTAASAVKYDAVSQATTKSGNSSNLKHIGTPDGTWEYTFDQGFDIEKVTSPVAVTYDPTARHRVTIQATGLTTNPSYDFRPDGKAMDQTRNIVTVANCNDCHTKLALHGGGRTEIEYCVVCHNPGTKGVSKNNDHQVELDMQSMIHKIHAGVNLPSNITYSTSGSGSGNYTIVGYQDTVYDYSQMFFPWNFPYFGKSSVRRIQDCTACHRSGTKTGDYANYKNKPTREACVSCHDNVDFASGSNHSGGAQADNSKCSICHTPDKIEAKHVTVARAPFEKAKEYQFNIISASNIVAGNNAIVTYSMTNPATGAYYDLTQTTTATSSTPSNVFSIKVAWRNSTTSGDWDNTGSTSVTSAPIQPQPISMNSNQGTANGNGTWTVTFSKPIHTSAVGDVAITADGRPTAILTGTTTTNIPVTAAIKYFKLGTTVDTAAAAGTARREIVSDAKCAKCHGVLSLHGSNRTATNQQCAVCHTPALSDAEHRRIGGSTWRLDGDSTKVMTGASNLDGKSGECLDMKTMIHGIHAGEIRGNSAPYTAYRIQSSNNNLYRFTEPIPGKVQNCDICHTGTAYTMPLNSKLVGSSNVSFVPGTGINYTTDPSDDIKLSPAASVCSGCHASTSAKNHMIKNGADFNMTSTSTHMESCDVCHGSGKDADVKKVHGL